MFLCRGRHGPSLHAKMPCWPSWPARALPACHTAPAPAGAGATLARRALLGPRRLRPAVAGGRTQPPWRCCASIGSPLHRAERRAESEAARASRRRRRRRRRSAERRAESVTLRFALRTSKSEARSSEAARLCRERPRPGSASLPARHRQISWRALAPRQSAPREATGQNRSVGAR